MLEIENLKFKYHFVYKTTNKINNKSYIGKHSTNSLVDGYIGSGKLLKRAIKKYGKQNFTIEFLEFCDTLEEAYEREECIIKDFDAVNSDQFYNLTNGGKGNKGYVPIFTKEWKDKISQSLTGKSLSIEHRENISISCTGREAWNKGLSGVQPNKCKGLKLEGEKLRLQQERNKIINSRIVECPYCFGKFPTLIAHRWHFENCKLSPTFNEQDRKLSEELKQKLRDSSRASEIKIRERTSKGIKESWINRKKLKCIYCDFETISGSVLSQYHNENCIHNPNNKNINKYKCPHCGFESRSLGNLKQYHFDNCHKRFEV